MAEETQAAVLSAAFPAPPPFYKHFTADNLARLKEVQTSGTAAPSNNKDDINNGDDEKQSLPQPQPPNLSDLPRELLYLIPPEPPASGHYKSFGEEFDISNPLPSLRSRGIEQLYPTPPASSPPSPSPSTTITTTTTTTTTHPFNRTHELTRLSRSLLLNYLDLLGTLSSSPSLAPAKIQDIRILFLNAHHLINGYRPHQARETMIEMVEAQVERRRAEIEGVRGMRERVEGILRGLGGDVGGVEEGDGEEEREREGEKEEEERRREKERERERRVWEALDAIEI